MSIFKRILAERITRKKPTAGETSKSSSGTNTVASNLGKTLSKETPKSVAAASDVGDPKLRTDAANTAARSAQTTPRTGVKLGNTTWGGEVKITKLPKSDSAGTTKQSIKEPPISDPFKEGQRKIKRRASAGPGTTANPQIATPRITRTRPTARVGGGEVDPSEVAAARKRGRDLTGGTVKNEPLVGGQKKPPILARRSVRGSFVVKQDQVSKLQKGYRQLEKLRAFTRAGKSTRARMSRAYGKNLAATGDAIIQSIRDKAKAETAVKSKSIVPSQTAAITKSSKGVLVPPASTKIEPVKIKVDDPPRSKPYRGIGVGSKETVSKATVSKATKVPELKQPKVPELKPSKVTGGTPRATDRVGSTSAPTKPTPTPAPNKPTLTPAQQKKVNQRILKSAKATKSQLGPRLRTKTVSNLAGKVTTQAAKVKAPKITASGIAGKTLGALGAGFDVVQGREDAKKAGASDTRSWLRGAARAAGGLVGGSLGATGGGLVGGIAGYSAGSALADKTFTALAGATDAQKDWMKRANLANQKGTAVDKVKYRKGNQAVIYDPRVKKERIGTLDPTSGRFKADNLAKSKAYTAKNPLERLGRQFARSNEGSGLLGLNIVKGHALADMAKRYYADKDEKARVRRVSDFKKAASAK